MQEQNFVDWNRKNSLTGWKITASAIFGVWANWALTQALADYYGQNFRESALSSRNDLEIATKTEIAQALKQATRATQKGVYHKIRHAGDLLKQIDSSKVRDRCPSCERLFDVMIRAIQVV